jgi:tetratricopeptide (TPR) repeat protein
MLPSHARKTLRGLSVFRHSFTVKAAEEIVGGSPASLALLVNRCLVRRGGVDRYEIHELLRQFASGKLRSERAEAESVRDRHASYYLNRVEEWFEKLTGPEQYPTLERMSIDMGNIHTALQRAAEAGDSGLLGRAVEGLFFYYDMRTQFEEADRLFRAVHNAYVQHPKRDKVLEGFLQIAYGWTGMRIQPDEATRDLQAGLELLPESAPTTRLHAIANVICAYASRSEEAATHLKRIQDSVEFYHNCGDAWGEGLARAAWSELERGHDEAMAETLAYESLRLHREAGDAWGEGLVLMSLGRMAEIQGHFELALTRYEQSQCLSEPIGADISGVINSIASQARVVGRLGQGARSEQLAAEALRLSRGVGNRLLQARASIELARARAKRGDRASSRELLEEAFRLSTYREWDYIQAECARMLLEMALDEGDVGLAERWLREADELEPNHAEMPALQERFETLRRSSS